MTEVEGPGRPAALWVQGCRVRFPSCANRPAWSFSSREFVPVAALFKRTHGQPTVTQTETRAGEVRVLLGKPHHLMELDFGANMRGIAPILQPRDKSAQARGDQAFSD